MTFSEGVIHITRLGNSYQEALWRLVRNETKSDVTLHI